jgi:hypothetical protein
MRPPRSERQAALAASPPSNVNRRRTTTAGSSLDASRCVANIRATDIGENKCPRRRRAKWRTTPGALEAKSGSSCRRSTSARHVYHPSRCPEGYEWLSPSWWSLASISPFAISCGRSAEQIFERLSWSSWRRDDAFVCLRAGNVRVRITTFDCGSR